MIKEFTIVIIHAGNISEKVEIERGFRQGDPIARLLFILCINTNKQTKLFRNKYQVTPFKIETIKYIYRALQMT